MSKQNTIKTALVTGAAKRIGKAVAEALHSRGLNVILHCHNSWQETQQTAAQLNRVRPDSARVLRADLADMAQVKSLADEAQKAFARVDVVINNASAFYPTPFVTASDADWDILFGSNVRAPYFLSQALEPTLRKNRGCIINLVDIYSEKPMPGHSLYSMAKAANRMMVMALAKELAPAVRVNGIAPGAILWPQDQEGDEIKNMEKLKSIPMGTLGGTAPIVDAVLYLLEHAPYTTGQILNIDGGKSLNL